MALDKGSLILLDYTAKIKDTGEIFDTTREEDAKQSSLYESNHKYEPRLISVGDGWVLKGLDESLTNTNVGDKLTIEITPDKGFGERDPNKVRMIPQRKLGEKAAEIQVGDVVEIEERSGIVRYIGSGRVQIDFNHRLAGKNLVYDVNIIQKLENTEEKIKNLIKRRLPVDDDKISFSIQDDSNLKINVPENVYLLEGLQIIKKAISSDIFKYVQELKNIQFVENYPSAKKDDKGSQPMDSKDAETEQLKTSGNDPDKEETPQV